MPMLRSKDEMSRQVHKVSPVSDGDGFTTNGKTAANKKVPSLKKRIQNPAPSSVYASVV
jgi:hypothetical protein